MTINLPQQSSRGVNRTAIEWADYAVGSPFRFRDKATGELVANACVKLSSGCAHCYAEAIGQRFGNARPYTRAEMDRLEPLLDEGVIRHILTFRPSPAKGATGYTNGRARPLLFLGDMTDIFGEWVPFDLLDRLFTAVALRPGVDFIVLTKRAKRMREYASDPGRLSTVAQIAAMAGHGEASMGFRWPLPNLWLYVSVEDQATADERIPHLLACPAAVRGVSAEPLLGPVDLTRIGSIYEGRRNATTGEVAVVDKYGCIRPKMLREGHISSLIIGGESGPSARPMHPDWARSLRDQCGAAGVLFFFKQWGAHVAVYDRDHDDPDWRRCDSVRRATPSGAWMSLTGGSGFHGDRVVRVNRVSKRAAGRLLDGREWNQMPGGGR